MYRSRFIKRILPMILVTVLLFTSMPVLALSFETEQIKTAPQIVSEVVELREESVKHFLCDDGSYIAVSYAEPVHYEKNGEWLEIDNTLVLSSENTYVPKSSDLAVSIPTSFSGGKQITATNNGRTISFGVASDNENVALSKTAAVKAVEALPSSIAADVSVEALAGAELSSKAAVGKVNAAAQIEAYNSEKTTVENQAGALVYDKIFPNADLEYIVTGSSIKENVVVYQPQTEYVYTFDMDFGGLTPIAEEDGSITLVDSAKQNKVMFVIAAPYMYDANGEESYNVEMALTENCDNYLLTLVADETWLNNSEREFPVVIDPTVYYQFDDVFVMNGIYANSTRATTELRVGRNLTNLTRTYIKPTVPTNIPTGAVIENAELVLHRDYYYSSSATNSVLIFAIDCFYADEWSPDTVTWNNQPFDNSDDGYLNNTRYMLSNVVAFSTRDTYTFDVTKAAKRWVRTGEAEGIMLASSNETTKVQVDFHSSRALLSSNRPTFEYTYSLPSVSISEWNLTTPSATTSSNITIITSESWTISVSEPWISVSKTSGTGNSEFTISAAENTSANQREGTVTVWMGSVKIGDIKVYQAGSGAYLFLDKDTFFIDYMMCSKTVTVNTNDETLDIALELWNNTDNAFVTVNIENNNSSADAWIRVVKNDDKIDLSVCKENTTADTKKARITVTAQGNTNTVTKTIEITQYDKVTCLFNTINEDGTLSAISSTEYNHALATWAMELSYAAYNYPDGTELPSIPGAFMGDVDYTAADVLTEHGFGNIIEHNYTSADCGAHTIAYRDIEYVTQNENTIEEEANNNGSNTGMVRSTVRGDLYADLYSIGSDTRSSQLTNTKQLVVVAIRGSVTDDDWDNNFKTQFVPWDNKFVEMKNNVAENLVNHISELTNPIILVTGHSLGAAIANLLAAELNSTLGVENVYAYTFATPQVVTESLGQEAIPYANIFNILNSNDVVTYMPTTLIVPLANFWSRHGIDIPLNMPYSENFFTEPTGLFCHSMAVYMAWMNNNPNMTYESIMEESSEARTRGLLPWFVRIKCPVGVTVKDSEGNTIAYESQEDGKPYPEITDTGIVSWIDDDGAKVFFMPQYADAAKIEIDAYYYGNMTMSMGLLGAEETGESDETDGTDETTEALNSITYNNVNLFPGRAFDIDLTEITETVNMDDITLMEVEVDENGNRTTVGEITDLNPYLRSANVDNDNVTCGTVSTITVVTDKDAVKIQLVYHKSGSTFTLPRDHANVVSLVEDGDNLIWTIQKAFIRGEHIFDVGVKMGNVWYHTERVFALTVTP